MSFPLSLWLAATGRGDDGVSPSRRLGGTDTKGEEPPRRTLSAADAELVARVHDGDGKAFDQIVVAHWGALCAFAAGYVKDVESAKELVADVFAALWTRRTMWNVGASIEAYLFGAVRNRARSAHRDLVRRAELLRDAGANGAVPAMGATGPGADVALELDERLARLQVAVEALPPRLREATVLRWEREMSYDEMAEVLGISALAARQLVSRALRVLRQILAE